MKTIAIASGIACVLMIFFLVSYVNKLVELDKANLEIIELKKSDQLYIITKNELENCTEALKKSDSIVNYHVEFDKDSILNN